MNLQEYKSYLSNFHGLGCDNNAESLAKRTEYINRRYSDSFLQLIIDSTEKFIVMLLGKMAERKNSWKKGKEEIFCELLLRDNSHELTNYISNNCTYGYHADKFFFWGTRNHRINYISEYLTQEFFGREFAIEISVDDIERYNKDEDSISIFPVHKFGIRGPVAELDKLFAKAGIKKKTRQVSLANFFETKDIVC